MGLRTWIYKTIGVDLKRTKAKHLKNTHALHTFLLTDKSTPAFADFKDKKFIGTITEKECASVHGGLPYFVSLTPNIKEANAFFIWGSASLKTSTYINYSNQLNKPIFLFEDGFIRGIKTWTNEPEGKYSAGHSFTVDRQSFYFDARRNTDLEDLLNSVELSEDQIARAREIIKTIVEHKITKYNGQPLDLPAGIIDSSRKNVLIVDQSYGDASLVLGLATPETFEQMIKDAVSENPDANILVKIHPDNLARNNGGSQYFEGKHAKIKLLTQQANPITLLQHIDKVYVATSQLGFEALLCGKEVHTYGMPFYAGWGVTIDQQKCERRKKTRSVEEVFYIAYILYSHYVNTETKMRCEIEELIDLILKLREEYFTTQRKSAS